MFPFFVKANISWEGHLSGFITGFIFATIYKTPNYVEDIQFEWEKPEFDIESDPFMKRFDENGNFVNPPKPEEIIGKIIEVRGMMDSTKGSIVQPRFKSIRHDKTEGDF